MNAALALLRRDLRLAMRRRADVWLPLGFLLIAASLFPFGIGADAKTLRLVAPGVVWVCVLLAVTLSVSTLYQSDHADGSLEQMLLSGRSLTMLVAARAAAHWLLTGLPMLVVGPLVGVMFALPLDQLGLMVLTLLLGTPTLCLLANLGAALVVGVRGASMLLLLLVLPLMIPVLIFGAGALVAAQGGQSPEAYVSLLAALLVAAVTALPWAIAAAWRIALS